MVRAGVVEALTAFLARGGEVTLQGERPVLRFSKSASPLAEALRSYVAELAAALRQGQLVVEPGPSLQFWILPPYLGADGSCARCGERPTTWWCSTADRVLRCSNCEEWLATAWQGQVHITADRAAELRGRGEVRKTDTPPLRRASSPPANPVGQAPPADGVCPHCKRKPKAWWRYRGRREVYCGACTLWEAGATVEVVVA